MYNYPIENQKGILDGYTCGDKTKEEDVTLKKGLNWPKGEEAACMFGLDLQKRPKLDQTCHTLHL